MPPRTRSRRNQDLAVIDAYAHPQASRVNIPTIETASMLTPDQTAPTPVPEPDADAPATFPTLNWMRSPLPDHARTYGPLYLHESVVPEELVKTLLNEPTSRQGELGFGAVNGFTEEDGSLVDNPRMKPYQYDNGHWTNRLIRGTAQRAMASLLYKDNLRGKVNLVYLDPPYNISFQSNFQLDIMDPETQEDTKGVPYDNLSVNAFRDNYRNGVHSYLDGLRDQLELARELLADDGSIIIQIGPDNLHYVAVLMSEILGHENHVATIPYKTGNTQSEYIAEVGNWLIWFGKNKKDVKYRPLHEHASNREAFLEIAQSHAWMETQNGPANVSAQMRKNHRDIPNDMVLYQNLSLTSAGASSTGRSDPFYLHPGSTPCPPHSKAWENHNCTPRCHEKDNDCPIGHKCGAKCNANEHPCPTGAQWSVSHKGLQTIESLGRMHFGNKGQISYKRYETEVPGRTIEALWRDGGRVANRQYIVETPPRILDRCVLMTTDPGDLVLDLTCGSGAMPAACERWGRRWIAVDVATISIAIARERIATTIYPYHILKDSPEGHRKDWELEQALLPPEQRDTTYQPPQFPPNQIPDPVKGFVNERQLRVTAATLAYGPNPDGSDIIRHPDRTLQDNSRKRVATPFTVESDSPYRSVNPATPVSVPQGIDVVATITESGFTLPDDNPVIQRMQESMTLSGIRKPGAYRFKVENLQPAPFRNVTHTGTLITDDGERLPANFYIAAEDEVVSATKTFSAALATAQAGVQNLIMASFGRDEDVHKTNHDFPTVNILQVQAHRDLQLANLQPSQNDDAFTVISEPEVQLHRQPDGQVRLEVVGLNAFDPAKGTVSPPNTHNVVGILTDTAYDGQSFKVRLINIRQHTKNQRTLRLLREAFGKSISAEKWEQMTTYTTVPFNLPMTEQEADRYHADNPNQPRPGSKIAVKVIDRTGTEHMTVLDDPRDGRWY